MRNRRLGGERRRRAVKLAFVAAALLAALALVPGAAVASSEPVIGEGAAWEAGGEIMVGAHINPKGLETSYEILLECPGQEICQKADGTLPALEEAVGVHLTLNAPQAGATYQFTVTARNADGKGSASWRFQTPSPPSQDIPPGAAPNGAMVTEPYAPPELPWANQSGDEAAERTVAEQRALEREEQKAKEAVAQQAIARQRTEEQAQQVKAEVLASPPGQAHPTCTVPALKGDTLTAARHALAKTHCRLGTVHRVKAKAPERSVLLVSRQSARPGKRLPQGAAVAVTVAPPSR